MAITQVTDENFDDKVIGSNYQLWLIFGLSGVDLANK